MPNLAKEYLARIKQRPLQSTIRIMNVCGGHERTISSSGLRSLLPNNIQLVPGPGCPVCVCPEYLIQSAIIFSQQAEFVVASFGDMLRVPVNINKTNNRNQALKTLEQSRSQGNSVYAIASPLEINKIALQHPDKTVIFFAAGFETTLAPIAAFIDQGLADNVKLLLAVRRTWPAVNKLLNSEESHLDALIAPGHVATIMGKDEWRFIPRDHDLPCAVAGFTETSILQAINAVCSQIHDKTSFIENCYGDVVSDVGNRFAQKLIDKYFDTTDAQWRGIGEIKKSGFSLKPEFQSLDATTCFSSLLEDFPETSAEESINLMPPGCDCDKVVLGRIEPKQCRLYAKGCTPNTPIGPCMVSDEGACHIWWTSGIE